MPPVPLDGPSLTLALVEAQVGSLVGQSVTATLGVAEREHSLTVRVRWLQHERDVLRLYVIHEAER